MTRHPIKAVLLDLDGTLYFKGAPIPGVQQALAEIRAMHLPMRFLTNTDSKTTETLQQQIAGLGLQLPIEELFTPASALLQFLQQHPGKRCYTLLSAELTAALAPALSGEGKVGYVVVGDVREALSYPALDAAFQHLMAGAELLALQKGRYYVRADGYHLDTGAFVQLFEYASGQTARVLGKPSPDYFRLALDPLGCSPAETLIVGDDLTTDVAGARQIGARCALVRTGKYQPDQAERAAREADWVIDSVRDLPALLRQQA